MGNVFVSFAWWGLSCVRDWIGEVKDQRIEVAGEGRGSVRCSVSICCVGQRGRQTDGRGERAMQFSGSACGRDR